MPSPAAAATFHRDTEERSKRVGRGSERVGRKERWGEGCAVRATVRLRVFKSGGLNPGSTERERVGQPFKCNHFDHPSC